MHKDIDLDIDLDLVVCAVLHQPVRGVHGAAGYGHLGLRGARRRGRSHGETSLTPTFMYCTLHYLLFGKFGPPFLGKATAAARAALPMAQPYKCMPGLFRVSVV